MNTITELQEAATHMLGATWHLPPLYRGHPDDTKRLQQSIHSEGSDHKILSCGFSLAAGPPPLMIPQGRLK
jgi:hypothetical protein